MDRKEFLALIGVSAGAMVVARCLQGCSSNGNAPGAPSNFTLNLDLTTPTYSALQTNGQYVYTSNGLIVARTLSGTFLAVSQYCTHQGTSVQYVSQRNDFYCQSHGSTFDASGNVTGGPAPSALKEYKTSLNGHILTVTG